jgi:hypothetical protein
MRTTIDLPDELFRQLKARAALEGVSMKTMVLGFVEQGLTRNARAQAVGRGRALLEALRGLDDAQFIATLEQSRADTAPDQHRESL